MYQFFSLKQDCSLMQVCSLLGKAAWSLWAVVARKMLRTVMSQRK